jgi:hypothetical protein
MALHPDLLQYQVGKETTWGTPVAGSAKLMLVDDCQLEPVVESVLHEEFRGTLLPGYLTDISKIQAKGKIGGKLTFEDIPYWLDALLGIATPTGVGPYVYAYTAPITTPPTPRIQTLLKGNGSNVYQGEGMLPIDAEFSFATNQPLKYMFNLLGQTYSTASLASLTDRAVNVAMGSQVALYIDALGGTIGTTAITTAFFSGGLKISPKRVQYPAMGSVMDAGYVDGKFSGVMNLTLLFDATSKAYLDAIIGGSAVLQKLVRIKATKDANHIFQLDFAGSALKSPVIFDVDNEVTVVKLELTGTYDSGAFANWLKFSVTNQVASLA